jgi:hypothetical protein
MALPNSETVYAGIGTTGKIAGTDYYYDGATDCTTPSTNQTPVKGNLTRIVKWLSSGSNPESRIGYDAYGNPICAMDANGNTSTITYDGSYTFAKVTTNPLGQQIVTGFYGVDGVAADKGLYGQLKSTTDSNGNTISSEYDVFGRTNRVIDPYGSISPYGSLSYFYQNYGTVGLQHVLTLATARNNLTCPTGYTYNSSTGKCDKTIASPCLEGATYNVSTNRCEVTAGFSCASGFVYNNTTGKCEAPVSLACAVGSLNTTTGMCETPPICSNGTYDATSNTCFHSESYAATLSGGVVFNKPVYGALGGEIYISSSGGGVIGYLSATNFSGAIRVDSCASFLNYEPWDDDQWNECAPALFGYISPTTFTNSILIGGDHYGNENPIRAGMTAIHDEYPWSGHHCYLGSESLPWLKTDWVLSFFSGKADIARQRYHAFVTDGLQEKRRSEFHSGICDSRLVGDDVFVEQTLSKVHERYHSRLSVGDVVTAVCRQYGITEAQLKVPGKVMPYSEARAVAAAIIKETPTLLLTELGMILNRDIAPLGRAGQRLLNNASNDSRLRNVFESLRKELCE